MTRARPDGDGPAAAVQRSPEPSGAGASIDGPQRDLAYLMELIGVGVIRLGDDRRIELANAAAHAFLDRPVGSLTGLSTASAFLDARIEAIVEGAHEIGLGVGRGPAASGWRGAHRAGATLADRGPVAGARGCVRAAPPPADPGRVHREPVARAADAAHDGQPARRDVDPRGRRRRRRDPGQDARSHRQDRSRDRAPRPDGQRAARPLPDRDRGRSDPARRRRPRPDRDGHASSGCACSPSDRASPWPSTCQRRSRWSAATRPGSARCSSTSSTTRSSSAPTAETSRSPSARSGATC